ncbi:MAG: Respiratory nitrate reductase 1 beta chain [Anaerolineales bacterium]|nr:Respiratory nitrate reductase 1 beta chain [Anaerolineales bacterium]
MKIRSQVSMVFHLDKCIGCHTCSIACKNIWTDRQGAEYMWWNNVETKPGTGFPTLWEDQEKYKGGWELKNGRVELKLQNRLQTFTNLFSNPALPTMDDYYEPWTYNYGDLFNSPLGDDQPVARPISRVDGKPMEIEAGPNWDDDLGGSNIYAVNDPLLESMSEEEKQRLFSIEQIFYFYMPRICNHCLNAGCVAACPSGAIYKRAEDGVVLINQDKCRGWRMCVSSCPYKKTYYNWETGKSEKCILCYPRLESGQAPACFHSCVGRIRYLGVLLYDADQILDAAKAPDGQLVQRQREMILDPRDPKIIAAAKECGIPDAVIAAAQRSPVYRYVKDWELALPLHPEYRTLPMLFYVPPLLPVLNAVQHNGTQRVESDLFSSLENARVPVRYMSRMLAAGNDELVVAAYQKMIAVRLYKRAQEVGDVTNEEATAALAKAEISAEVAEAIYRLTSLPTYSERFVVPPYSREGDIEEIYDPQQRKAETGFGRSQGSRRGL